MSLLRLSALSVLLALGFLFGPTAPTEADTVFTVTNTNPSGPGSLHQAINDANSQTGKDTITFSIPESDPGYNPATRVWTICPASPCSLPEVADTVMIDGFTQPGALPNSNGTDAGSNAVLKIRLDGGNRPNNGLVINAPACTIQGLAVTRFISSGIYLSSSATNTVIRGNHIGIDPAGTTAAGNIDGIIVQASGVHIGGPSPRDRNIISGNYVEAIYLLGEGKNVVQGNFIGTDATGTLPIPNQTGVEGYSSNNQIGGVAAGSKNLISGNRIEGIVLGGGDNSVQGNYIGTDVTGTARVGEQLEGVRIYRSFNNRVGGATPAARNIISGNAVGVSIVDANDNWVKGNYIGLDATGRALVPNAVGLSLSTYFSPSTNPVLDTVIGGSEPGAKNVIAGNLGHGILIKSADVSRTLVQANTISNNGGAGVYAPAGTSTIISANQINSNGGLGIDLGPAGVTPNDSGDSDEGANNLQNFPELSSATTGYGQTQIAGKLFSTPSSSFTVQFFSSTDADPSGWGEGETLIGSISVATDQTGEAGFAFKTAKPVSEGRFVTSTATDSAGNTSEFSDAIQVNTNVRPPL